MKKRTLLAGALLLGSLFCAMFFFILPILPISNSPSEEEPEIRSEKSWRMEIAGYPDRFAEYHRQVRLGDNGHEYPINYKLDEFNKARSARKRPGNVLPWEERGPGNFGGRTRTILVDVDDPTHETWFAGSVGGGIWLTTDAGETWMPLTDDLPNLAIGSIAQSESNPDVLYAGTGEGYGNLDAVAGSGIFKTVDHGETWTQLAATATEDYLAVNRLIVDPENDQIVLAATNTGIFRSIDGGAAWNQVYEDEGRVQDLKYQPGNFAIQFAADNSCCILRSTDGGQTWSVSNDVFYNGAARIELATSSANPDWVYAAVELQGDDRGGDVYFSMDAGDTWTLAEDQQAGVSHNWFGNADFNQGWYDNAIAVHPFSPDTILLGGISLWKSNLAGSQTSSGGAPTAFNEINTETFLDFVSFTGGSHFGGRVDIGTVADQLIGITLDDMTSVEIRFGPGQSQKAHRFTVLPTAGTNGDGGAGIPYASYIYQDYVDVPFEVWDTDNNVQLMASFRDQSDDGLYNLILRNTEGPRDTQSREYIFIHAIPYDAEAPDAEIPTAGAGQKAMYFMWPVLAENGTWDGGNLPDSQLGITFSEFEARVRQHQRFTESVETGGLVHVDHHVINIIPIDAASNTFRIINGNDGGVYYSENNGRTWKARHNGYVTAQFYDADKKPGADDYIAGSQDNGTWRSFANPTTETVWRSVLIGDGFDLFWHPQNANKAIFSYIFNTFYTTDNGGITRSLATTGLGDASEDKGPFMTSLGWSKDRPDVLFAVGASGVWRSDNFATNWTLAESISEIQWGFSNGCKVRVSLADPDYVWAGCQIDAPGGTRTMHLSRDGGQTFDPIPVPEAAEGRAFISGLATHPIDAGTAYVLFSRPDAPKIIRTTNSGLSWTDISGFAGSTDGVSTNGFPDVAVNDLLVLPNTPNEIWVGTEIGLFISRDDGETWEYADNGLPAASIWRLREVDGQILAATHGRGLWTVPEPLEVANETEEVPASFNLAQNYPNPFNPKTTIDFSLPAARDVQIKIYDVGGREVATLVDGFYPAGDHNVTWNAQSFASGVYLYRMTAGDFTAIQQMTLLK